MTTSDLRVSKAAHLGGTLGLAAAALVVVGVASASFQLLPAFGGFLVMVLGLGVALVGLVTSVVGLVATAPGKRVAGRPLAMRGLMTSVVTVVALAVPASQGSGLPRINDMTTSFEDPPVFVAAVEANGGRDMSYPGAGFAEQQKQAYPDLDTLVLAQDPDVAFDLVHAALASMPRMEILDTDRQGGRIEGTETSALFRFKDDIVVRIRPSEDGGSRIDARSKSRDGKGDLGVNAARIRTLFERVKTAAASE